MSALPETATSMVVTTVAVGAAATLLVRSTKDSEALDVRPQIMILKKISRLYLLCWFSTNCLFISQNPTRPCEDCGGSGICAECKGEGFVLKKLSEESADRLRMLAKNMATRNTAGYDF